MRLYSLLAGTICLLLASLHARAFEGVFTVTGKDIHGGYVIERLRLSAPVKPQITLSSLTWKGDATLPTGVTPGTPDQYQVILSIDRKVPYAIIRIPAYSLVNGRVQQLAGFTLTMNEPPATLAKPNPRTNDVTTSALNSGTWYKIGITKTGFYKIDYSFLTTMGVNPANINPANVRILGNGGAMLPEGNGASRPIDLLENSVQVNDNGDNVFDNGESLIFYGTGPMAWYKDSLNQRFRHQANLYSDTAYYFISFNSGAGKRVGLQPSVPAANVTVTDYNYRDVHEQDLVNPAAQGKNWFGEQFSQALGNTTQSFTFNPGSYISSLYCAVSFASTSATGNCRYSAAVNGSYVGGDTFSGATTGDQVMNLQSFGGSVSCNSATASVAVTFYPSDGGSIGYLDYVELNGRAALVCSGDQLGFRDWASVGAGHIAAYKLAGANSSTRVWDVTNPQTPVVMNGSFDGSNYNYSQDASTLHEFAAMNSSNVFVPKYVGTVPNQNLHGLGPADLVIVTYPGYIDQANRLKAYHEGAPDNMRVTLATTTQVYNEFSSGAQDISAIRDFAKMFYDRAGSDSTMLPKYLLLFGGASYDYKSRLPNNCNFVPLYESSESRNDLDSYSGDDYFGFLDDAEDINYDLLMNTLDIGVGRLPARSTDDATNMVDKIIGYRTPATLGPWRISATIVADKSCDGGAFDGAGQHMDDAELMAAAVATCGSNNYNEQKIFVDAMPIVSTPAGARCPIANAALNEQVFSGTFLINYNGHGNPTVWSSERILTGDDFNQWNNKHSLPFMVTATCDFGQYDHPQFVSSAEQMVVRKDGGVIAILTTTQAVYHNFNDTLNLHYLQQQFTPGAGGAHPTFGEAGRRGKNVTYVTSTNGQELVNFRKFALLGDPALTPDFPENVARIDSVIDGFSGAPADTVKALGAYTVKGSVRDLGGNVMSGFNGTAYVAFYDKPRNIITISGCYETYALQDNIVYKGRVTVTNGVFSFSFIAPRDLNYDFGAGKISLYADNGATDAAGNNNAVIVGGYSDHPVLSSEPPIVKAYLNDTLFRNGGITGSSTSLYATFYDKTGINVSGTNIGHDLTAVLDDNVDAPYILNNYYETAPNTYQYGYVSFAISGLTDGRHSLKVRAWDVNDNVGEGTVDFVVVNGKVTDIEQLGNYPNPFSGTTHFVFEHNHPFEQVVAEIEIYNVAGALVKNIKSDFTTTDSRTIDITWDGADNQGRRLPSGVYVYRLNLTADGKYKSSAYQKLVIVR